MTRPAIERRASYGASSPTVGLRGARTRREIVAAAMQLFATQGFHATSVDDIVQRAGVSRATLYQYFANREELFVELLEECGTALVRVARRLGTLGPTAQGFDNLAWWLGEWAWIYDRFAVTFVQWAHVNSRDAPLRPLLASFVESHTRLLSKRIAAATPTGLDPDHAALALLTVAERYNYYRHTRVRRPTDDALHRAAAVVAQRFLFPETPAAALRPPEEAIGPEPPTVTPTPPAVALGPPGARAHPKRTDLSPQGQRTIRQLLDAGAHVFAANGYAAANVDLVVAAAGVARGTFYKYFDDKLDLLLAASDECAARVHGLLARLGALRPGPDAGPELRTWLRDFVDLHVVQTGVFRTWVEEEPPDPRLLATAYDVTRTALLGFRQFIEHVDLPPGVEPGAVAGLVLALLERLPDEGAGTAYEMSPTEVVETVALFIERGVFGRADGI